MQILCIICGSDVPELTCDGDERMDKRFCSQQCRQAPGTTDVKFWSYVNKSGLVHPQHGQCWEWLGAVSPDGYGNFSSGKAHHFSWSLHFGDRGGKYVLHKCDNRKCVNPSHLMLGTHYDNMADMMAKGRQCRGSRNGKAKLTDDIAREIRRRYVRGCPINGSAAMAAEFGCHKSTILAVATGLLWKHVQS